MLQEEALYEATLTQEVMRLRQRNTELEKKERNYKASVKRLLTLNKELEEKLFKKTNEICSLMQEFAVENEERMRTEKELTKLNNELTNSREEILEDAHKMYILNEKLAISEFHLKEANAAKDKFLSIIAHDLINPLQTLIFSSEFLIKNFGKINNDLVIKEFHQILGTTQQISDLLNNLLQWARSQSGRIEYSPEIIDMNNLAVETIRLLENGAKNKNITIINELKKHLYPYADPKMLKTVLRNLITNAIKFTQKSGQIRIKSRDISDYIEISVTDTGIGMSSEDMDKLFRIDVHHTTIGTSKEKGTGLGLIICKEFIDKNGGKIRVESKPGKGSAFIFTLPKATELS